MNTKSMDDRKLYAQVGESKTAPSRTKRQVSLPSRHLSRRRASPASTVTLARRFALLCPAWIAKKMT